MRKPDFPSKKHEKRGARRPAHFSQFKTGILYNCKENGAHLVPNEIIVLLKSEMLFATLDHKTALLTSINPRAIKWPNFVRRCGSVMTINAMESWKTRDQVFEHGLLFRPVGTISTQMLVQPLNKATTIPIAPKALTSDPAHVTIYI